MLLCRELTTISSRRRARCSATRASDCVARRVPKTSSTRRTSTRSSLSAFRVVLLLCRSWPLPGGVRGRGSAKDEKGGGLGRHAWKGVKWKQSGGEPRGRGAARRGTPLEPRLERGRHEKIRLGGQRRGAAWRGAKGPRFVPRRLGRPWRPALCRAVPRSSSATPRPLHCNLVPSRRPSAINR